jgi:hypothetical protein
MPIFLSTLLEDIGAQDMYELPERGAVCLRGGGCIRVLDLFDWALDTSVNSTLESGMLTLKTKIQNGVVN